MDSPLNPVRFDEGLKATPFGAALDGAWRFALVSLVGFGVWAFAGGWFHSHHSDVGLYITSALVFIAASGLLMHPLIKGKYQITRFYLTFGPAFLAYAAMWCCAWFLARFGAGEWIGSVAGSLAFVAVCAWRFSNFQTLLPATLVLFVTHSLGYFLGGKLMEFLSHAAPHPSGAGIGIMAKLSWGLVYGLGFGAGIGFTFFVLQKPGASLDAK